MMFSYAHGTHGERPSVFLVEHERMYVWSRAVVVVSSPIDSK